MLSFRHIKKCCVHIKITFLVYFQTPAKFAIQVGLRRDDSGRKRSREAEFSGNLTKPAPKKKLFDPATPSRTSASSYCVTPTQRFDTRHLMMNGATSTPSSHTLNGLTPYISAMTRDIQNSDINLELSQSTINTTISTSDLMNLVGVSK